MNNLIEVINDRCVGCSACVRVCPSPEANIVKITEDGRTVVEINNDSALPAASASRRARPEQEIITTIQKGSLRT